MRKKTAAANACSGFLEKMCAQQGQAYSARLLRIFFMAATSI